LGVIDSLSAGYRFLGWRFELIVIPVVLDLLLWLGPRFSIAPLFHQFSQYYGQMATTEGVTPELGQMVNQLSTSIDDMGAGSNLVGGFTSGSLLHVPSLPLAGNASPTAWTVMITSPVEALLWWGMFSLVGLLIGVIYLTLLARRLPIGSMASARSGKVMTAIVHHWLQVVGFVILVGLGLLLLYLPVSFVIGMLMLVNPTLGSTAAAMAGGLTLVVFFYLYFVTAALIMDDVPLAMAIVRSARMVQDNFWPTLGFIVVSNLIGVGFALLLSQLAGLAPWGEVVAIVINAYIGTGISLALLVFYRSRVIRSEPVVA
jgi:hypothetical protein